MARSFWSLLCLCTCFCVTLLHSQEPQLYVRIGDGESCEGTSEELTADEGQMRVGYDFSPLYNPLGVSVPDRGLGSSKSLRMSICGAMTPENTACGKQDDIWCFEEVNLNGSCIAGIARWEQSEASGSKIQYDAMFSSQRISPDSFVGVRVSVLDYTQSNISCPNERSVVNYDIVCAAGTNWTHMGFTQNITECHWNVTLRSQHGCVEWIAVDDATSVNRTISGGSVFLIIFVIAICSYCLLGVAYNSFYHGRELVDAVPNKTSWLLCARYTRAGCETSRDVLCCKAAASAYESV
eukprot:CAMPEP_0202728204 /NCGR_PEP_ID=MMETSP1385-20130828/185510_1 /ASSEMBLY_ACC=CAM_ASM_000861 /TAXON_ID=933848 /ORGANISM="Elphidium margaritaceum" /LENGTH=294 /DNA_ID=CAMNT_0049394451 /DNA_START=12 /DNA_END=896 /DNA_ORIENTATION=+